MEFHITFFEETQGNVFESILAQVSYKKNTTQ